MHSMLWLEKLKGELLFSTTPTRQVLSLLAVSGRPEGKIENSVTHTVFFKLKTKISNFNTSKQSS